MVKLSLKFIGCFALILSCSNPDLNVTNLNGNEILAIGHGGMGEEYIYPMNSIESVLKSLNIGIDGVEIDLQLSRDGELIAFHDERLEHTTTGEGVVYERDWHSQIRGSEYRRYPNSRYSVVRFVDILSAIDRPDQFSWILDIKSFNPDTSAAYAKMYNDKLFSILEMFHLLDHTMIEYKRSSLIEDCLSRNLDIPLFYYAPYEQGIPYIEQMGLRGLTTFVSDISKQQVEAAHAKGIWISAISLHSKRENREGVEKNVDILQTDRVKHLVRLLK